MQKPDPYAAIREAYMRGAQDAIMKKPDLGKYIEELKARPLRAYFSNV